MAYRWTENGPAFEFATPFGVENRFLAWRASGLLALALLIVLVVSFFESASQSTDVLVSEARIHEALLWPHYLTALTLALFGSLDAVRASRQRTLRVERGQPAPLMPEVRHESAGCAPGADTLIRNLGLGELPVRRLPAAWAQLMRRLGPVEAAPLVAHTYLGARLAQLLLGVMLLVCLGAAVALGLVLGLPHAGTVAALFVGVVALGFAVRQALLTGPLVLSATAMAVVGALVLVFALALAYGAQKWPLPQSVAQAQWPSAVALALALGLVCDLLGLMAMREQLPTAGPTGVQRQEERLATWGDPAVAFQELERELFRRWTEGVPNRRHMRQPPAIAPPPSTGRFKVALLEESLPVQASANARPGGRWLRALSAMGMAFSLVGGGWWLWLAWAQMHDLQALWLAGVFGGAFLIAGIYAMRLGHLPWSRVELTSNLIWIEAEGVYEHLPPAPGAAATVRSQAVALRVYVVQAQSAFYAAAQPLLGSRSLVGWTADPAGTQRWLDHLRGLGQDAGGSSRPAYTTGSPGSPAAKRPARFCAACAAPVLAGARFCQQCGSVLDAG